MPPTDWIVASAIGSCRSFRSAVRRAGLLERRCFLSSDSHRCFSSGERCFGVLFDGEVVAEGLDRVDGIA